MNRFVAEVEPPPTDEELELRITRLVESRSFWRSVSALLALVSLCFGSIAIIEIIKRADLQEKVDTLEQKVLELKTATHALEETADILRVKLESEND